MPPSPPPLPPTEPPIEPELDPVFGDLRWCLPFADADVLAVGGAQAGAASAALAPLLPEGVRPIAAARAESVGAPASGWLLAPADGIGTPGDHVRFIAAIARPRFGRDRRSGAPPCSVAAIASALRAAGFARQETFLTLPSWRKPRAIIPAALAGIGSVHFGRQIEGRSSGWLALLARLGWAGAFAPGALIVAHRREERAISLLREATAVLAEFARTELGSTGPLTAMKLSSRTDPAGCFGLLAFAPPAREPLVWAKLPRTRAAERPLANEAQALADLAMHSTLAPLLPLPFARLRLADGRPLLAMTAIAGRSGARRSGMRTAATAAALFAAAAALRAALDAATGSGTQPLPELVRRTLAEPIAASLQPVAERAAAHLLAAVADGSAPAAAPLAAVHGDFVPDNLLARRDGSYALIDWEHYQPSGAAWTDRLQFLFPWLADAARARCGRPAPLREWLTAADWRAAAPLLRPFLAGDAPAPWFEPLFALHTVAMAAREARLGTATARRWNDLAMMLPQ
ncbi:MAG: hypothetical protein FJ293_10890 [Planctomycetes bacterium]|nr:hypothetical protein [Planctomycetota bacterium]